MIISLRKIGKTPSDFEIQDDKITFKGFLQYDSGNLILLKAKLCGIVNTECSRCGEEIDLEVDEDLKFFISDGLYKDDDNIEFDVVESFNSMVDLNDLLKSEIELIKSDYHICDNCK
ncbi:MAG: hypothetical protein JXQ66_03215 [Campylobacterales bacterium]|nr:hypothetical protein [Campylobacterales bacterium]